MRLLSNLKHIVFPNFSIYLLFLTIWLKCATRTSLTIVILFVRIASDLINRLYRKTTGNVPNWPIHHQITPQKLIQLSAQLHRKNNLITFGHVNKDKL